MNHQAISTRTMMRLTLGLSTLLLAQAPLALAPLAAQAGRSASTSATLASRALRPGDGLRVRIFLEPTLSGEFVVDERGMVVLPKLGEWPVQGVPADSVRPRLLAAYKRYLTTDAIEIMPFRRVAVTGAVLKPGLYPIDPSMSVADAVILAGGVAPNGKRDAVELRLAGSSSGEPLSGAERIWESGAGGVAQLYVPQRSWVARNLITTVSVTLSILTATALLLNVSR